jgi:hypothetical protein
MEPREVIYKDVNIFLDFLVLLLRDYFIELQAIELINNLFSFKKTLLQ